MIFTTAAQAIRQTGLTYIGEINHGAKHKKAYHYNELVYTIYFAPAKSSGYEVCPGRSKECTMSCLNMSGMNRMIMGNESINRSRIKKTKLFFEEKEFTVRWIIDEIKRGITRANRMGYNFSVRLNNTSDISPEEFYIIDDGKKKNLLEIFPNITFYDYTKVPSRIRLTKKYQNYDLTFSFNGSNLDLCKEMLKNNIRITMVFNKTLPEYYMGYKVVNGDLYDMRYKDPRNVIVGLHYKRVRNQLESNNKFVIQ